MNPEQDNDKVEAEELSVLIKEKVSLLLFNLKKSFFILLYKVIYPHQSCDSYENYEKNGNFPIKFNYFLQNPTDFLCVPYYHKYNFAFSNSHDSNLDPSFFRWDRLLFIPISISFSGFSFFDEILWDINMTDPSFLKEFSLKWLNDKLNQSFISQNQKEKEEFFRFDSHVLFYNKRQENPLIQIEKDENLACFTRKTLSHEENECKFLYKTLLIIVNVNVIIYDNII